ncbi:cis-prenyltransferase [Friedmanniomyces endolithicus]|nr:cis-prenyltransferase [Friedmanniomyces endolithicus]
MATTHGASLRRWLLGLPPLEWALHHLRSLLIATLKCGPIPQHIAFVMDGNRRYARTHHLETVQGHHLGFEALARVLEVCYKSGVKAVTIYAFSIENFKRSKYEVDGLMDMAKTKLVQMSQHGELFDRYGARVRVLGDTTLVRRDVLEHVERAVEMTRHNGEAVLNVCFPYTSREEITRSIRETVREFSEPRVRRPAGKRGFSETHVLRSLRSRQLGGIVEEDGEGMGKATALGSSERDVEDDDVDDDSTEMSEQDLDAASALHPESSQTSHSPSPTLKPAPEEPPSSPSSPRRRHRQHHLPDPETLTEEHLDKNTYTYPAPPLDLLIRTSGVYRLSDFMLWQCHEKTEIRFLDCLWPEFDLWYFLPVLLEWQWRRRREVVEESRQGAAGVKVQ